MEDGDTEKYHASSVIQDFLFLSGKRGSIRCISLLVYNKDSYCGFKNSVDPAELIFTCKKKHRNLKSMNTVLINSNMALKSSINHYTAKSV